MYIKNLEIKDFRNFYHSTMSFRYPGGDNTTWPNITLLLGTNGSGKTNVLRALARGLLDDIMPPTTSKYWVRNAPPSELAQPESAKIKLEVLLEPLELGGQKSFCREVTLRPAQGAEVTDGPNLKALLYDDVSPSLFILGYGASRWSTLASGDGPPIRNQSSHPRYQRVASLFEDHFGLMPLEAWLPGLMFRRPLLAAKLMTLIQSFLPPDLTDVKFLEKRPLYIGLQDVGLPMSELSDGYRSYLAWICDLAYHLGCVAKDEDDLTELSGVVMVDEVDLHLHPKWQQKILKQISERLPKLQFIFTSHSPLVAGTLPAANLLLMGLDEQGFPAIHRPTTEIEGLDADQILLSDTFGLKSSRSPAMVEELTATYQKAITGDPESVLALMELRSRGMASLKGIHK